MVSHAGRDGSCASPKGNALAHPGPMGCCLRSGAAVQPAVDRLVGLNQRDLCAAVQYHGSEEHRPHAWAWCRPVALECDPADRLGVDRWLRDGIPLTQDHSHQRADVITSMCLLHGAFSRGVALTLLPAALP